MLREEVGAGDGRDFTGGFLGASSAQVPGLGLGRKGDGGTACTKALR